MPNRLPIDHATRDRIANDLGATLFVEAGAGTGKTTALVARIVSLLRSGVPVEHIAAITFTEKAAAELMDRVREELETLALDPSLPQPEQALVTVALHDLDGAAMQTLHAFARRIVAAHAFEAGVPPGLTIVDDLEAEQDFESAWTTFLDDCLGEEGPVEPLEFLYALGMSTRNLRDLAIALNNDWDRIELGPVPPTPEGFDDGQLRALVDQILDLNERCTDPSDKLYEHIAGFSARLDRSAEAHNAFELLEVWQATFGRGRGGAAKNWPGYEVSAVKDVISELEAERSGILQSEADRCLRVLVHHVAGFVVQQAQQRRESGRLRFHDLLVIACSVLRGNDEVRAAVHRRYTHILVDEFQDTDPLQAELASLIARDPTVPASLSWEEAPVEPGRLFVVGDPKQSIYRFRRADVALYRRAATSLGGEQLNLVQNFRSGRPVIAWVNHVFATLMDAGDDPAQATYEPLEPWHPGDSPLSGAFHIGREIDDSVPAIREAEAADVAAVVTDLLQRGATIREGDAMRTLRRSDIAVLFPKRAVVPALEAAFDEANIPYRVESRGEVFASQELRDIENVLTALVDPSDEVALVASLRSPVFGCSDAELHDYFAAGGRWNYLLPGKDAAAGPVADAMRWLREFRPQALALPVNLVVEHVLRERRLWESSAVLRRARVRWQRYRLLLELARDFANRPGADLADFVQWMRRNRIGHTRIEEVAAPESDDEAVRLMTIHASKGLEFPVVILVGLSERPRNYTPPVIFEQANPPFVKLGRKESGVQSLGYDEACERQRQAERYEEIRLLYVAATRARDTLVVSTFRQPPPAKPADDRVLSPLEAILEACPETGSVWRPYPFAPAQPAMDLPAASVALEATPEAFELWREARAVRIAAVAKGNAIAATAIAKGLPGEESPEDAGRDADVRPWKRGRAGTSLGRAVHAVLQVVDLATGDGLQSAARTQATAEGLANREHEIERNARRALDSQAVREAVASARHWRELFAARQVGAHLLEGFIDLLYERADGFVVVDYKTDEVRNDAEVDAAVERYRLQLAAYALLVEGAIQRPVVECRFVFANEHGLWERSPADLDAAKRQLETMLAPPGPVAV